MPRMFCPYRLVPACLALIVAVCVASDVIEAGEAPEAQAAARPRAGQLGIRIGILPAGPNNAITDVAGVLVGHHTLWSGEDVRTGVTAILPHDGNLFQQKVPAAIVVGNGFGKLVGLSQVEELGNLETPIVLTNTLSVFTAADAVIDYTLGQPGNEQVGSVNPVVGETNDGYLNDIRARHVRGEHVRAAIGAAGSGPVEEGAVGAGTGTRCFGFKGSAPPRVVCPRPPERTPWACWCSRTSAACLRSTGHPWVRNWAGST
jgi:D-aminopeptidase